MPFDMSGMGGYFGLQNPSWQRLIQGVRAHQAGANPMTPAQGFGGGAPSFLSGISQLGGQIPGGGITGRQYGAPSLMGGIGQSLNLAPGGALGGFLGQMQQNPMAQGLMPQKQRPAGVGRMAGPFTR